jgi:hypothetical protein
MILSRILVYVAIDGVWNGYQIYWPLLHTTRNYTYTALPLISTLYSSPQHPVSIFQPAVSSTAVSWSQLLTFEILQLQLPAVKSSLSQPAMQNSCQFTVNCQLPIPELSIQFCAAAANCQFRNSQSSSLLRLFRIIHSADLGSSLYSIEADLTENTVSINCYIDCLFIVAGHVCLAVDVSSGSTIPAFRHHVTILIKARNKSRFSEFRNLASHYYPFNRHW